MLKTVMNEENRIKKDIKMFEENLKKISIDSLNEKEKKIVKLASQYYEDSKYYLDKKDGLTAFGCINYAHGLLDAVIKF